MATIAFPWPNTIRPQRSTPRSLRLEDRCARTPRNVPHANPATKHADRSTLLSLARPCFITCGNDSARVSRSEEHTSELQSRQYLVCRLLLEKKKKTQKN